MGRSIDDKRAAYRATFFGDLTRPHPTGRIVLADLRNFCGIEKGGLVVSPVQRMTDPYATVYRAAQRDVYLRVVKMLGIDIAIQPDEDPNDDGTSATAEQ